MSEIPKSSTLDIPLKEIAFEPEAKLETGEKALDSSAEGKTNPLKHGNGKVN